MSIITTFLLGISQLALRDVIVVDKRRLKAS